MNQDESFSSQLSPMNPRKLRTKFKRHEGVLPILTNNIKKKKFGSSFNKMIKSSLKKKKKNVVKKIINQIDFNHYKKIFCSAFNKFDPNNTINPYKSNFQNFYSLVKGKTESNLEGAAIQEEKEYDMSSFMKNRKECVNLKSLEKTKKVLQSTLDLLDKDPTFLENFDFVKVCSNVNDIKIKLDQARKIIQKYNLNEEYYNTNNQRDESIEQMVFNKRLKLYEKLKDESNFVLDSLPYDVHFSKKGTDATAQKENEKNDQIQLEQAERFSSYAHKIMDNNKKFDMNLEKLMHDSQLEYILKFDSKDDINEFHKNLRSMAGNINIEEIEIEDNGKARGWKIFKSLISQNLEGKSSTGKTLEILTSKERLRTQRKSSDFLYYEPSVKKNSSLDQELKRTPKDKGGSITKRKPETASKLNSSSQPMRDFQLNPSSNLQKREIKNLPNTSMPKPKKSDSENSKIMRASEILIEDYRDVLHHAFRNLSTQDPNFTRMALSKDEDIERKTGISLRSLPQPEPRIRKEPTQIEPEPVLEPPIVHAKSASPIHNPSNGSQQIILTPTISTPPPSNGAQSTNLVLNRSQSQNQSQPKSSELGSPSPNLTHQGGAITGPFQLASGKKITSDSKFSDMKNVVSPQLKTHKTTLLQSPGSFSLETPTHIVPPKNTILDKIMNNNSDGKSIGFSTIFNSMDISGESNKKTSTEGNGEKPFIKKNNIILTNNLPNA